MGGSAFASGPDALYTPRMPAAVYCSVRDRCLDLLRARFVAVASPVEGPGKTDFGDVDILVALPRAEPGAGAGDLGRLLGEATARLGAVRSAVVAHEGKASMAIPWPAAFEAAVPDAGPDAGAPRPPAYVQVDLAIAADLARLHWALFKHAHGDLWNILGAAVLRPLGLTVDERALWLRVPEIEQAHRSAAKVFLADEPAEVLHFLGLRILDDAGASLWEAPFATAQALFAYAATCPFFVPPAPDALGDALKANDRRRLRFRPLFRQWATEFVPSLPRGPRAAAAAGSPTRASVRDAAFAYFPGAQQRFVATRTAWLRTRHLLLVRAAAKAAVPAGLPSQYRGEVCAAVRRHLGLVMDGPGAAGGSTAAAEAAAAAWTEERVTAYVQGNWKSIAQGHAPAPPEEGGPVGEG